MAGDFRSFQPTVRKIRTLETGYQIAKGRHWRAFLQSVKVRPGTPAPPGWGGRIRTSAWGNQNPLPYHLATPQLPLRSAAGPGPRGSAPHAGSIERPRPFQPPLALFFFGGAA